MRSSLLMNGLTVTTLGLLAAGCAQSETPPGPGPTATPQVYQNRPIGPGEPINAESRQGAPNTMHDKPQ